MERCNELCTREATGQCTLCDALADRDQFFRFWFKGGLLIDGVRALKKRGVFAFFVSRRTSLPVGLVALLLLFGSYQFFWAIPNQQIAAVKIAADKTELSRKEFYELRNSIRQTFLQALGGAALLLGLYFTARTLRISQETLRTNQEGQITERFTKAIEHLGDKDRLTVRLGGIYALERIARDSAVDHWQIMEVLTAYVRDNAPWPPKDADPSRELATDIQAALTVLGRRTQTPGREKGKPLDLYVTNLQGALLTGNLNKAIFNGAHLEGAGFMDTHLENTLFIEAYLTNAFFIRAHLKGAKLTGAKLERADFRGADLTGADLTGAQLQWARLAGANLGGANLSYANLESADLTGADLRGVDFDSAHLEDAILTDARLEGAKNLTDAQRATISFPGKYSGIDVTEDEPDPSL